MGSSQGAAGQNKLWAPFMESPAAHLDLPPLRKEKMVLCNPALPNASPSLSSCWHYSDSQCRRNNVTLRADSLLVLQPPWECQTHIGFFADHCRKNRADTPRSIAPGKASPCSPEGPRLLALTLHPARLDPSSLPCRTLLSRGADHLHPGFNFQTRVHPQFNFVQFTAPGRAGRSAPGAAGEGVWGSLVLEHQCPGPCSVPQGSPSGCWRGAPDRRCHC